MALTNWAGNLTYRAAAVHHPETVAQVQDLVARLPRVRALGTRHSFSAVADRPGGDLVSLAALPPDITVDAAAMTVSVTGGTRYGELIADLHAQGFALHNTGSLPHISVAGATATGTHGSGDANGILSTAIVALEVVRADGACRPSTATTPLAGHGGRPRHVRGDHPGRPWRSSRPTGCGRTCTSERRGRACSRRSTRSWRARTA